MAWDFGTPVTGATGSFGTTVDVAGFDAGGRSYVWAWISQGYNYGYPSGVVLDPGGLDLAFTELDRQADAGDAESRFFYLLNPPAGSYTVRGTYAGACHGTMIVQAVGGVDVADPHGTVVKTGTQVNPSVTAGSGTQRVVSGVHTQRIATGGETVAPGTAHTEVAEVASGASGLHCDAAVSNANVDGSCVCDWVVSPNPTRQVLIAVPLNPAPAAGGPPRPPIVTTQAVRRAAHF